MPMAVSEAMKQQMAETRDKIAGSLISLQEQIREIRQQMTEANDRYLYYAEGDNYRYALDLMDTSWRALEHAKLTLGITNN